jgi:hypothetical protein
MSMRIDVYGLGFETPRATFYLWSPWRASALEHRLFEAITSLAAASTEQDPEEWRVHVTEPRQFRAALQAVCRVLKGWQEDADAGQERRSWRWLVEADTDAQGYDHQGEQASLWGYLRLSLDRGGPGEPDKGEDVDLNGFGLRIWPNADQ